LKTHLTDVEVVSFEDGIHDMQLQKPEDVARLILEFLAKNVTHKGVASSSDVRF